MTQIKKLVPGAKYSRIEVKELKEIFDGHDKDKDGKVTLKELISGLSQTKNLNKREIDTFRALDVNMDGVLTFKEYLMRFWPLANDRDMAIMLNWVYPHKDQTPQPSFQPSPEQLEEIKIMFSQYDKNKNGAIEKEELLPLSQKCGYDPDEFEELFKTTDKNLDGVITFEEFIDLVKTSYVT